MKPCKWCRTEIAEPRPHQQRCDACLKRAQCSQCGRPTTGAARCDPCRAVARARDAARKAEGKCTGCPLPAAPGCTRCPACRDAKNALTRDAKRYARNLKRIRAQCWVLGCTAPAAEGKTRCPACATVEHAAGAVRSARHRAERHAAGDCPQCGREPAVAGRKMCETCNRIACDRYAARVAAGMCGKCGKRKPDEGRKVCETCLARLRVKAA